MCGEKSHLRSQCSNKKFNLPVNITGWKLLLSDVVRGEISNVLEPTRVTEGEVIIDESKEQNVDMNTEATVEEETSSETEVAKSMVPTTDHLTLGELDQPQDTEIEQEPTTRQATTDE
ncbi:hypothetical protein ANN_26791 [Periplaneta americana]|uniref:Uncharacterized protein n=1 Tax=Periplaneta americana TaxID=6978 RepID=A0ABQ8RZB2_PERAM|nr:hypothetical protein ANN_26791 [Periplaneta americana]